MFMHDPGHTGVSEERLAPPVWQAWEFPLGQSSAAPVAAKGIVYAGNWAGEVFAVEATGGKLKWKFKTRGPVCYAATVAHGRVGVGSADGTFYAIDADSGRVAWQYQTGDQIWTSPIVVDDTVYFGSNDRYCYALDMPSGDPIWKRELDTRMHGSPAAEGDRLFVLSHGGILYALDRKSGAIVWKKDTGAEIFNASPSVRGGVVYVALSSRRLGEEGFGSEPTAGLLEYTLRALRAQDGSLLWETGGGVLVGEVSSEKGGSSFYWATPTVSADTVFVQGTERGGYRNFWNVSEIKYLRWPHFYVVDSATGKLRVKKDNFFALHGRMMNPTGGWCAAALTGHYLVGCGGVIDVRSAKLVGHLGARSNEGNPITTAAAISEGKLFIVRMGHGQHPLVAYEMGKDK
jgi:outer membrane protein assembly factor BamB